MTATTNRAKEIAAANRAARAAIVAERARRERIEAKFYAIGYGAEADDHTCIRGAICEQMEHYLNCPHTSSDEPGCHCAPCDHQSCTVVVFV